MSTGDDPTKKVVDNHQQSKIEILQEINPKSVDFMELRVDMISLAKDIKDKVRDMDESSVKDYSIAIKTIKDVLDFESKDKIALLHLIKELPKEKLELIEKMLEPERGFANLNKQVKFDKEAEDVFS